MITEISGKLSRGGTRHLQWKSDFASGALFSVCKSQTAVYSVDSCKIQIGGILTQQSSRRYWKLSTS